MDLPQFSVLEHRRFEVAAEINRIMLAAYQVEANILGVADFVPLRRTAFDIAGAKGRFVGGLVDGRLAAVAEIEAGPSGTTNIASLAVDPADFRKGIGSALVRHLCGTYGDGNITVSTGARNIPALRLYAGFGFGEQSRWFTDDGIAMVTLVRRPAAGPR